MKRGEFNNVDAQFTAFQRGEESGFTFFFKLLYKPVLQYALNLVDDEAAAEDIVEESFIKLWEKRQSVQSAASLKPYLYTIVRNSCIDFLNKNQSERTAKKDIERLMETETDPLHDPIGLLDIHLNVEEALQHLPRRKSQIFSMFHLQQKSIQQIAWELNLSPGSVKNQKSIAMEMLRLYFSKLHTNR